MGIFDKPIQAIIGLGALAMVVAVVLNMLTTLQGQPVTGPEADNTIGQAIAAVGNLLNWSNLFVGGALVVAAYLIAGVVVSGGKR